MRDRPSCHCPDCFMSDSMLHISQLDLCAHCFQNEYPETNTIVMFYNAE